MDQASVVLLLTEASPRAVYPIRPGSGTLVDTAAYALASSSRIAAVKVPSFRFLSSVSMIALNKASAASCCVCFADMAFRYHPSDARFGESQNYNLHRTTYGSMPDEGQEGSPRLCWPRLREINSMAR